MRSAHKMMLPFMLFLPAFLWSRQQSPQTQLAPTKDLQALQVVNQALAAAGGISGLQAISDFTATGNVTYYSAGNVADQGTVTIRGRGLAQLRIDSTLPLGTRSEAIDGATTLKFEDGSLIQPSYQSPLYPVRMLMPALHLAPTPTSSGYSLLNNGTVLVDGNPACDIQVQRAIPIANDPSSLVGRFLTVHYFIDVVTAHVVMMQDVVLKGSSRQIRYADFRPVGGLSIAFSISETIQGQAIRQIQLDRVTLNSGLQDSDFQL